MGLLSPRSHHTVVVGLRGASKVRREVHDLEVETPFWRGLEDALRRNVDLRPREGAVARAVEDSGERCYERKS